MKRVLVVDDDADLLEVVTLIVQASNYDVVSVLSGADALEELDKTDFDVIIMDVFLGDSDGRDLCKALKLRVTPVLTPVLLYSAGNISSDSINSSMADGFLQKPFDMTELIDNIERLVS